MTAVEVLSSVLLVAGAALAAVAGLGLVRFPDVLSRMHAATKPATLGLVLVAAGAGVRLTAVGDVATLVLIVVLQLLTAPVGAHLVGRAVRRGGALRTEPSSPSDSPDPSDPPGPPDSPDPPGRSGGSSPG